MKLDTFLYFICAFIDIYATELDKNNLLKEVELYRVLRRIHLDMVYMLALYDKYYKDKTKAEYEDYYSFFFENVVKDDIDSKTLFKKYFEKELEKL